MACCLLIASTFLWIEENAVRAQDSTRAQEKELQRKEVELEKSKVDLEKKKLELEAVKKELKAREIEGRLTMNLQGDVLLQETATAGPLHLTLTPSRGKGQRRLLFTFRSEMRAEPSTHS